MKKNGSALAYVLILLSALLIVCTGVSSYVIGTTKLNKSYSTIIDSNLDLDSAVNVAREYIISEITKKKNTILNEADIDNIKHDINDSTYNDAKKSNDIIKSLNSIIHITRNGMWPSYTYEIKATDNEGKKSVYQNIYFNVVLDIVSSGDTATAPYNIPKQNNELVDLNIPEWDNSKANNVGDKVIYNGIVYVARNSTGANSNNPPDLYGNWIPVNDPIEWSNKLAYTTGFKTVYKGVLYEATSDISNSNNNPQYWGDWRPVSDEPLEWMSTKKYLKGDRVIYNGFS